MRRSGLLNTFLSSLFVWLFFLVFMPPLAFGGVGYIILGLAIISALGCIVIARVRGLFTVGLCTLVLVSGMYGSYYGLQAGVQSFVNEIPNIFNDADTITESTPSALDAVQATQAVPTKLATTVPATLAPISTLTVNTPKPTPSAMLVLGTIVNGGNLRIKPQIDASTVIGQVCPGDTVAILEQTSIRTQAWYRIQVTALAGNCDPQRIAIHQEGWLSSTLIRAP